MSDQTQTISEDSRITKLIAALDMCDFYGDDIDPTLRKTLTGFSDSTLDLIEATTAWNVARSSNHYNLMTYTINQNPEHIVREIMFFRPLFTNADSSVEFISHFVIGLHRLNYFKGRTSLEELTGIELSIAVAFLNITMAVNDYAAAGLVDADYHDGVLGGFIGDGDYQQFVVDQHQHVEAIISFIEDRGTVDPDLILLSLESGTALMNGVI
jgi:hypothetical protein